MRMSVPEMNRPRLDIKNSAKSPTSSGVPARPAGEA